VGLVESLSVVVVDLASIDDESGSSGGVTVKGRPAAEAASRTRNAPADWLRHMPYSRPWLWLLLLINLGGAVYGFFWYESQLRTTPAWLWPVTPDCPLACLLFAALVTRRLVGRRSGWFEALTYMSMVYFGVWTVVVLGQYWAAGGHPVFEDVLLFASHAGMVLEAAVFLYAGPVPMQTTLWPGFAWLSINYAADYGLGVYPGLPNPAALPWVRGFSLIWLAAVFVLAWTIARRRRRCGSR